MWRRDTIGSGSESKEVRHRQGESWFCGTLSQHPMSRGHKTLRLVRLELLISHRKCEEGTCALGLEVWAVTPEIDESTTKRGERFGASTKFNLLIATCGNIFFNSASPPITSSIQPSLISSWRRSATIGGFYQHRTSVLFPSDQYIAEAK